MSLVPEWRIGDLSLTEWPFAIPFGADYGTPDMSAETLASFLTDGDLELTSRAGNRTLTLPVWIEDSDLAALAKAEAALVAECDKQLNTLYVDPGDGFGEAFQFTVFRGQVTFQRDDDREQAGYRLFQVVWRGLPWPESTTEVTVPSLPTSGSTVVSVDDMSSASAWTASVGGSAVTPSASAGTVTASSPTPLTGTQVTSVTRTGAIDTSSTKYLVLEWKDYDSSARGTLSATADGVALFKIAEGPGLAAGYRRSTFRVAANSVTALTFSSNSSPGVPAAAVTRGVVMDQLSRTDILLGSPAPRQQLRIIDVAGSMPSRGSLAVQHETSALGDVLIYTAADDGLSYTPACRLYRVAGVTPVSDSDAVSGYHDPIGVGPSVYSMPTVALPEGDYGVAFRARSITSPSALQVQMSAQMDGTPIGATWNGPIVAVAASSTYAFYRSGMVRLPLADSAQGALSTVVMSVLNTASGITAYLDEVYLFNLTRGRLSQFQCGSGVVSAGNSNRLWIESPDASNGGFGRYLRGTAANASDAYSALLTSGSVPAVHEFAPGLVKTFVVTTGPTTPASVSYRYRPAGHSSVYSGS